jgi:hypothetical protein
MALSELAALDAAYQTLQPLDPAGRRRALQWLADALAVETPLTTLPADPADAAATAAINRDATTPAPNPRRTAKPATRQPRRRTAAAASEAATPAPASKRTRGTRAARTATTGTAQRAQANPRPGARAYRRMPPAEEVMIAYQRIGSVSGLAAHFGVPGHTVQGWARQLRRHGYPIGQTR